MDRIAWCIASPGTTPSDTTVVTEMDKDGVWTIGTARTAWFIASSGMTLWDTTVAMETDRNSVWTTGMA